MWILKTLITSIANYFEDLKCDHWQTIILIVESNVLFLTFDMDFLE